MDTKKKKCDVQEWPDKPSLMKDDVVRARNGREYSAMSQEMCVSDPATLARCHFALKRVPNVALADVTGAAPNGQTGDLRVFDVLGFSSATAAELSLLYQAADARVPALLRERLPRPVRAKVPRTVRIPRAPIRWDAASRLYYVTFDEPVRFFQFAVL